MKMPNLFKGALALCALGILLTISLGTFSHAYPTTTLGVPGASGRPLADTVTNARTDGLNVNREVIDSGAVSTAALNSSGSIPVNVTFAAGVCWCSNLTSTTGTYGYTGPYTFNLDNTSAVTVYAYVNTTKTTISNSIVQGVMVPTGTSAQIQVGNRDGETVHLQAVSTPGTVSYSVSIR